MRHVFHFCWHKAREYLGHLFFIGLFIVLLSRSPEQWVDDQLKRFDGLVTAPDAFAGLKPLWPPWLDVRMVLVGLGIAVSAGSVGWRQIVRRRKQREALRAQPVVLPYETLGPLFKGREALLRGIRARLTGDRRAEVARLVLSGTGGVGKTRAAVEYAWAHRKHYTALLLVTADAPDPHNAPEALRSSLAALVNRLELPEREATDQEVRRTAVLRWLRANPGWLLIIDNVDTPAALAEADAQMVGLSGGHLLMTSRLTDLPPGLPALAIDLLSPEAAVAFLLERTAARRAPAPDDGPVASELALQDLGRLALALEHAGAYISHLRCGLVDYRDRLGANRAELMRWFNPAVMRYPRAVADTWQTSIAQLTEPGRHLLERLAFLAPDPVPEFLLEVPVPGTEAEDARAALGDLAAYSLATRDPEGRMFLVHRLVQDVTRRRLEEAGTAAPRLTEALGWVDAAFVGDPQDVRSWPRLDPLAPHAEAVAAHADGVGIAYPTARLMNQLGLLLRRKALHARAEPLMRRVIDIFEASLGSDHPNVATSLNNLAGLLQDTNRLGEAEPLLRRALAIDEASYGNDHPEVATDLNNLALLLQATNRLGEAEPLLRRALAITEASFGNDHPNVAIRLNNLAGLLQDTNRRGEAEPLLRRALAIDEASLGSDHPDVARDLNNLGVLLRDTNRLGEAELLLHRVVTIYEASLGKDHPSVATALNNLGVLVEATGHIAEAEQMYRRALAIDEASLGAEHPEVARDLNNLADTLTGTGRSREAEPLMRRMVAILLAFQRDTGHVHPNRDAAIRNYAGVLAAMGRSEPEIVAALATVRREVGLDQP
jgi:tetratricopeptide (TPR) repeat protein